MRAVGPSRDSIKPSRLRLELAHWASSFQQQHTPIFGSRSTVFSLRHHGAVAFSFCSPICGYLEAPKTRYPSAPHFLVQNLRFPEELRQRYRPRRPQRFDPPSPAFPGPWWRRSKSRPSPTAFSLRAPRGPRCRAYWRFVAIQAHRVVVCGLDRCRRKPSSARNPRVGELPGCP